VAEELHFCAQGPRLCDRDDLAEADRRTARRCTAEQMDTLADLADKYSFGEIRVGP